MMDSAEPALITHHPAVDETRTRVELPVRKVTLLEDRAQVRRAGSVTLAAGHNRLAVFGTAPVVQDVSLRAELVGANAKVLDVRVRRAIRVGHKEKPEAAADLERRIEELARTHREEAEEEGRADERAQVVLDMMKKAMQEVPEDAAWSLGHPQTWRETFEALSGKARALLVEARAHGDKMEELAEQIRHLALQRSLLARPDAAVLCVVEIDVEAAAAGGAELALEYTVPNALWRPFHTAELAGGMSGKLRFRSQAAVWQNTGEDWNDAELVFSTARSSLGHEPPKLGDDKLAAKKKDARVVVEAREVAVQNAGMGRGSSSSSGAAAAGVNLPGVDDGGDIQNLRAQGRVTVPSDGRPAFVPVFDFESPAEQSLVVLPELDEKAFFKCVQENGGKHPVLAGPVELVKSSGFVGTTKTLFVAPGEKFALGFGPDSDVRVQRTVDVEEEVDEVDQWRRKTVQVSIFLSNLGGDEKPLEIQERLPVSEIEHVKVTLVADKTSGAPVLDENGILTWKMPLPPLGRMRLQLVYVVGTAPGVQGL